MVDALFEFYDAPGRSGTAGIERGARLSDCGNYRYTLTRHWGSGEALMFVMLNPSTADAMQDDPTIRRCISFAKRDGYDGIVVQNLYAIRSTDPKVIHGAARDPIGPETDTYLAMTLTERVRRGLPVVAAWGAGPGGGRRGYLRFQVRMEYVRKLVPGVDWRCLGMTKAGAPRHPLYVAGSTPLTPWAVS